ncbi:autotransporter assembly complex protein TamA [Aliiroseovarius sp.]|uniref:autotransporter assembly complex protein TamA n=1 Tax=Aliiroseovarius sp. TaxID=1872442 RepID=UPI003BAD25EC
MTDFKTTVGALFLSLAVALTPTAGASFDQLDFTVSGDDTALQSRLEEASLLVTAKAEGKSDPRDLVAAALADYTKLLNTLYARGYYGGVIHIRINGREAAGISPFSPPARVEEISVQVIPGPQFTFGTASITPRVPNPTPTPEFARGAPARSTVVGDAVQTAAGDWRNAGHALVRVEDQSVTADHPRHTLDARVTLTPGPRVRFGELDLTTPSAVRAARVVRIAGLPSGQVFSPEALEQVAARLRRTGAFSSVVLSETTPLRDGEVMDIGLALVDAKPRRFGFGAELSSLEGLSVSGFWLHRNLFGGAERFRVEAEVSDMLDGLEGMDFTLDTRLDIPAALGTDTGAFFTSTLAYVDDPAFRLALGGLGVGVQRRFSDQLEGEVGVAYTYASVNDALGRRRFSLLTLPGELTWDGRDDPLDATSGIYAQAEFTPFHDLSGGATGARAWVDGRGYLSFSEANVVLAGRTLIGSVIGAEAASVPSDFLFYSGGGGTVRGFPYQSLGIEVAPDTTIGGRSFLGASGEVRYRLNDSFGLVGFADAGTVGDDSLMDFDGDWQIGAGLGLRYYTGLGPIRLDVAMPVSGPGGSGPQLYIGIGQSF